MVIVWTALALIGAIVIANVGWIALPLILAFLAKDVHPMEFAAGNSVPHASVNFVVGTLVGFLSLHAASRILQYAGEQSVWPILMIFAWLALGAFQNLRFKITPYSQLAAKGNILGLVASLAFRLF